MEEETFSDHSNKKEGGKDGRKKEGKTGKRERKVWKERKDREK